MEVTMVKKEKSKYSDQELKEFQDIILDKLEKARKELKYIKTSLSKNYDDYGADSDNSNPKGLEDGADTAERENLSQLAARQQKFMKQLENALIRTKNGTYGICVDTGKLIQKERLKAVPHTIHSIEAKLRQNA